MNKLSHKEACFDLAVAKGTQYIEVPLGSVWLRDVADQMGNADVISIKKSYTRFNLDIYEVKVNRSDFLQDVKNKKYEKYIKYCHRLYYAVLEGVATKDEIPDGIGLLIKGESGWYTAKTSTKRNIEIPNEVLLSLVFFNGRSYQKRRINLSFAYGIRSTVNKSNLKGFGRDIRNMILNYNDLELKFSNLLYEAAESIYSDDEARKKFKEKWRNITYIYGR